MMKTHSTGPSKQVVIYRAHQIDRRLLTEISKLRKELFGFDIAIVGYAKLARKSQVLDVPFYLYDDLNINSLPYSEKLNPIIHGSSTGNNDLPVIMFFQERPHYEYYWIIEYDVRYTGSWADLFSDLVRSDADLLCTTVQTYEENPRWHWWYTLRYQGEALAEDDRIKGFMPFARLSRSFLQLIDSEYENGLSGHYETAWPSICRRHGLTLEDIGGDGSFTPPARLGKHYWNTSEHANLSPGTFVFRPAFADVDLKGEPALWHPVKY